MKMYIFISLKTMESKNNTKVVLFLLDGIADNQNPELGGKTPL
jgi:hypothetical protein